jgi:hypothetical protein
LPVTRAEVATCPVVDLDDFAGARIHENRAVVDQDVTVLDVRNFVKLARIRQSRADVEFHTGNLRRSKRLFLDIFTDNRVLLGLDDYLVQQRR